MKYKMIVLDLDHTLLCEDRSISEENKQAIQQCQEAGIAVVIATGRTHRAAIEYAQQLQLSLPMINCQGAMISRLDGTIVFQQSIANELSREVLEILKQYQVEVLFCHGSDVYSSDNMIIDNDHQDRKTRKYLPVPEDIGDIEITKVGALGAPEHIQQAYEAIKDKFASQLNTCKSATNFLEITHKEATKSNGVAKLATQLGITQGEIIAFGDSMNDIDLLQYAGLGVAVSNGMEELKRVADVITDSNEEHGVAKAIYQYVL